MVPEPTTLTVGELRVVHHSIERMSARLFAGAIDENYRFGLSATEQWILLTIGGRSFGFWRASMELYEADEHGAMGDDPVTL